MKPVKLTLDENHIYRADGRIIRSVTQVLQDCFGVQPHWTEWHAQRGTAVHQAIHYLIQDRLNWYTVDPRILGKVQAFQKFIRETGYIVLESEVQLFSRRYRFAGTLDLELEDVAPNDCRLQSGIIADIKSSIEPIVDLQIAAYTLLKEEQTGKSFKRGCAVHLKDDGTYSLHWVKDIKRKQRIFLACLAVSNWQAQNY